MFGADFLANLFLGMFFFGLIFTVASLLLGFANAGDLHIPGFGDAGHADAGNADAGHSGHADSHAGPGVFNLPTIMATITWLGGVGYLLRGSLGLPGLLAVPLAIASGLVGGTIMFWLLARVLWPMMAKPLVDSDYSLPGTLARVVSPIREDGVGEIVYTKADSRFTAGARAADGKAIAKGTEVVILAYERGLAQVRSVEEMLAERDELRDRGEASTETA
jgi:hypothetical protein